MQSSQEIEKYLSDFQAFENNGASYDPAWLKTLRLAAIGKFSELGFPTVKQEDWRFTNILPLTRSHFRRTVVQLAGRSVGGDQQAHCGWMFEECFGFH